MSELSAKKRETRGRILAGAGRVFRKHGFGGIGVDGLAGEAGVTSGAFYANFPSKSAAFREVVEAGLKDLRNGVQDLRAAHGQDWRKNFVDFYLTEKRTGDLSGSCALQSLTGEVARADADVRATYETEFRAVIDAVMDGLDGDDSAQRRSNALALLSILVGGVSLARAVQDPALSDDIARAVRTVAERIAEDGVGPPLTPRP